uniref:Uncharacterized protein n=1 Tax=Anopheles maculatus TaxID=74869 RepID=A0A182T999_9DIPT
MVACVRFGKQRVRVGLVPDAERAVKVFRINRKVDELRDRVREEQCRDRVGGQLIHVVRIRCEITEDGEELHQHHDERPPGVHLPDQDRAGDVAEQEVAARLHQPYVRHKVSHQADIFGRLDLHLKRNASPSAQVTIELALFKPNPPPDRNFATFFCLLAGEDGSRK